MLTFVLMGGLILPSVAPANSAPSAGARCLKAGATLTSLKIKYTCLKIGNKLSWDSGINPAALAKAAADKAATAQKAAADKVVAAAAAAAAAKICTPTGKCPIGITGPGGGIVFYDAGSQQSWGRYLEFAPNAWSGAVNDTAAVWCDKLGISLTAGVDPATVGEEVGKGKANTNLMVATCTSGAAVLARAYLGGGKADWFLPSKGELNELCKFSRSQASGDLKTVCNTSGALRTVLVANFYWSSTEFTVEAAWVQDFGSGPQNYNPKDYDSISVRPIRAF